MDDTITKLKNIESTLDVENGQVKVSEKAEEKEPVKEKGKTETKSKNV